MDTLSFFKRVLAVEPNHVLTLTRGKKIFWNRNYPTLETAAQAALKFDTDGLTVYHALGSFAGNETVDEQGRPKVTRKAVQAARFKSLACDIDVGEGKPHESQLAAAQSVAKAVKALGLPAPMLVSSGWGLHCYWPLTTTIDRPTWSLVSAALRDKLLAAGLALDTSKIADPAMVLRPVGTTNRKVSGRLQMVRLLRDCPDHLLSAVQARLSMVPGAAQAALAPRKGVDVTRRSAMLTAVLNSPAQAPADPKQIVAKCAQLGAIAAARGNVVEPLWYLALGVANYCTDVDATATAWSDGHPNYTTQETSRKLQQWKQNTTGPATCAGFEKANPATCATCHYRGKVASPVQLSVPAPDPASAPAALPYGYRIANGRVVRVVDGVAVPVCNFPLIVKERYFDRAQGKAVAVLEATLPAEGTKLVELPIDTLAAGKDKWTAFLFNHSIAPGPTEGHTAATRTFLMTYLEELQNKAKPIDTYSRFGWVEDGFVLGTRRFHAAGVEDVELASTVTTDMRAAYETRGSLDAWVDATEYFSAPGMEYYAMCLLIGMGAPLLAFTDLDGFVVSMYSPESGTGKTTTGHMINSIWGNPKTIQIGRNDTMNAMYHTLVQQHNLPAYFEEITNITGEETSDFVYNVAHGRERRRLTEKATLREGGSWKLPVFTSTNRSLISKLQNNKLSSEGELQRLIEYPFCRNAVFDGGQSGTPTGLKIAAILRENHGLAGPKLLAAMCRVPDLQALVASAYGAFHAEFKFEFNAKERYLQAAHVIAYLAGRMADRLGLIKFDFRRAIKRSLTLVSTTRRDAQSNRSSAFDVIGMFTNEHTASTVYENTNTSRTPVMPLHNELRAGAELRARFEVVHDGKGQMNAGQFYCDRAYFNRWCQERGIDAGDVIDQLKTEGVSINTLRVALGRRTPYVTSSVWCYQINLMHHEFAARLSGIDAQRESLVMVIPGAKKA